MGKKHKIVIKYKDNIMAEDRIDTIKNPKLKELMKIVKAINIKDKKEKYTYIYDEVYKEIEKSIILLIYVNSKMAFVAMLEKTIIYLY